MNKAVFALFAAAAMLSACDAPVSGVIVGPCSTPANTEPEFTVGARLKPYLLVANDGTTTRVSGPFLSTWFDTKLGVPCSFRSLEGGEIVHCIPQSIIPSANKFSDALCSLAVAIVEACDRRPKYASEPAMDVCWPSIAAVRPLGDPLPPKSMIFQLVDGQCVPSLAIDDAHEALPIGDVMPWTEFVSATQSPDLDAP